MARSKRTRKLSGSQFADPFILPNGRSVIKGFDADDGDFIGFPSDAKLKLLNRKGGVLIKGKGFRSMVKGATVADVKDSLEVLETASGWDQYKDPGVIVQTASGRLIFSGKGDVFAPSIFYKDWRIIDITGEVSFTGEGMVLDGGDTAVSIYHYNKLGDIKIDGGGGKDVIHLGPSNSSPTDEGSIDPKDIEVLRLDNGSQRWSIDGEHPDMSVEIWDGGIEITGDTRLNKISLMLNDQLMESFKKVDPDNMPDPLDPNNIDSNHQRKAFVVAKKGKGGNIVDFNEVFTSETERLAISARNLEKNQDNYIGIGLLQGDFDDLLYTDLYHNDPLTEYYSLASENDFPISLIRSPSNIPGYYGRFVYLEGINKWNPLSSDLLDSYYAQASLPFDKLYTQVGLYAEASSFDKLDTELIIL